MTIKNRGPYKRRIKRDGRRGRNAENSAPKSRLTESFLRRKAAAINKARFMYGRPGDRPSDKRPRKGTPLWNALTLYGERGSLVTLLNGSPHARKLDTAYSVGGWGLLLVVLTNIRSAPDEIWRDAIGDVGMFSNWKCSLKRCSRGHFFVSISPKSKGCTEHARPEALKRYRDKAKATREAATKGDEQR
jgi:hypothetical protein